MKILTKQEAIKKGYKVYSFSNGNYEYPINTTGYLIHNGKLIAKGKLYSYSGNRGCTFTAGNKVYEFDDKGQEVRIKNFN